MQVAIDGPVAAGKSTTARRLAESLGFVYVDTGAIYRAVTLAALERNLPLDNELALVELANGLDIDVRMPQGAEKDGRQSTVVLEGKDVSWEIRSGKVTRQVAQVAALPKVREVLVAKQQAIAEGKDVVMEGRDIAEVVLPQAEIKIFLTASDEARVERYYQSRSAKKKGLSKEEVAEWLKLRDETDRNREASPLRQSDEAWLIDSSNMEIDEVVAMIVARVHKIQNK